MSRIDNIKVTVNGNDLGGVAREMHLINTLRFSGRANGFCVDYSNQYMGRDNKPVAKITSKDGEFDRSFDFPKGAIKPYRDADEGVLKFQTESYEYWVY